MNTLTISFQSIHSELNSKTSSLIMPLTRPPILRLPNELVIEVAKNLDPITLKDLIETYPNLANLLIPVLGDALRRPYVSHTPICWAAMNGYGDLAKILLENGADMYTTDNEKMTAFHWAARRGIISLAKALLGYGFEINRRGGRHERTGFHYAVEYGRVDLARYLVKKGANIALQCGGGQEVVHLAVSFHSNAGSVVPMLEFLLQLGVDIGAQDKSGRIAVHLAAKKKSFGESHDVIAFLLKHGVGINVPYGFYRHIP